jgi:hypothetical protein
LFPTGQVGMRVPRRRVPDPTKPVGAGDVERLQHRCDPVAQVQVGVADDGSGRPAGAIEAAGAGGGQPLDKLDLPDGAQLHRAIRTVHGAGLDKHGGAHIVAALHIGDQLVQQIPLVGDALRTQIPEVMMGIADGQLGLQGRFLSEGQPVIAAVWHKSTSVAEGRGTRSTYGRGSPVRMRQDGGVSLLRCGAPAYQETLCHTILEHLRNRMVHSDTQLAPYPCLRLTPRNAIMRGKEGRAIIPSLEPFALFDAAMGKPFV